MTPTYHVYTLHIYTHGKKFTPTLATLSQEHCEEYGRMLQADPAKVSSRAKKRGLPQVSISLHVCTQVFHVAVL